MLEPLLASRTSDTDIGKDTLGKGFKDTIIEQIEVIHVMSVWEAFSKMQQLRETVQQFDSIIESVQSCLQKSSDGGSAVFVCRLFDLKSRLSASPGYSSWVLRCIADIVDEKLGEVTVKEFHGMINDVHQYVDSHYTGPSGLDLSRSLWGRAILNTNAWSVQNFKEKAQNDKDAFIPASALNLHDLRLRTGVYSGTGPERAPPLIWFLWGLVRNVNAGYLLWLDEIASLEACRRERGRLVWTSLAFPILAWSRRGILNAEQFRHISEPPVKRFPESDGWEWALNKLVSVDLPKLQMELVDLRSAMNEKLTQVTALQAKALALFVSVGVAGAEVLGKVLMKSTEDLIGNSTQPMYLMGNFTQPM